MAKLGEILWDKMLVTKITSGGIPIEYYNIETQKRTVTDYSNKIKDKSKIHSLSHAELSSILQTLNINYYRILRTNFMAFLKAIQQAVNKKLNDNKAFVIAKHEEDERDFILYLVNGEQIEICISKETI